MQYTKTFLTSTHNLCFGAQIRKKVYPRMPQFDFVKVGYKGVFIARTYFPDGFECFHVLGGQILHFHIFVVAVCNIHQNNDAETSFMIMCKFVYNNVPFDENKFLEFEIMNLNCSPRHRGIYFTQCI